LVTPKVDKDRNCWALFAMGNQTKPCLLRKPYAKPLECLNSSITPMTCGLFHALATAPALAQIA
jgi:hypothetical protein